MPWKIPLADLDFGLEEQAAVREVLESRWLTMGAISATFEDRMAEHLGVRHAIAVTNATAGLHLACLAAGLGPGDEVLVPSLSFVATANAVRYVGATPVFVDVTGLGDFNMSPVDLESKIGARTKAVIVMHYGGYPCDMHAIMELAARHNLVVLEDAAHAIGGRLDGRALGGWGNMGVYSFFSNKNLATGEGGMLVTDDSQLADRLRRLRSHGMTSMTWDRHDGHAFSYDVLELGYNYRIDELRAALGLVQLAKLSKNNALRRLRTDQYRRLLADRLPHLEVPFKAESEGESACHILPILLPPRHDRMAFMSQMKDLGIQTSIHYPPIHQFSAYAGISRQPLQFTEEIGRREVTLPLYPNMTEDQVLTVIAAIEQALAYAGQEGKEPA